MSFAHILAMGGGWHNRGSKTATFGLPFGILSVLLTTWFFVTALRGHLPSDEAQAIFSGKQVSSGSITSAVGSAATQSVALLSTDDVDAADGGVQNRGQDRDWYEGLADSSEVKPDPAANPLLDSTFHARRSPHRRAGAKHHRKIVRRS